MLEIWIWEWLMLDEDHLSFLMERWHKTETIYRQNSPMGVHAKELEETGIKGAEILIIIALNL